MRDIYNDQKTTIKLNFKSKLFSILPPAVLIVANIFLFGPFTIYQGNINEFLVAFPYILKLYVMPALILLSVISIFGLLLPNHFLKRYIAILLSLGVLIWLQGNIFVWNYGLLNGQVIDWTTGAWRGWVDGALWSTILILAFVYYRQFHKIATFASVVLICLQLLYLGFISIQKPQVWKVRESQNYQAPKQIFQFSTKLNVIHFVLDGFQADIFQEIFNENSDYYKTALNGFTFFNNTTGSFPTTYLSVPAMLSGRFYQNNIPMPEFVALTLNGKTIPNVLYDNGFEVDLIHATPKFFQGRYSNAYCIPVPYGGTKHRFIKFNSTKMMDLVLFRYSPHFLKKKVYNNQIWLLQHLLFRGLKYYPISHRAFLDDLIKNMTATRAKPVYKYLHFNTTHAPIVVNCDCKYSGKVLPFVRKNIIVQAKCGLDQFLKFLDKLKSLGIWDSSLIVLSADHGAGQPVKMTRMGRQIGRTSLTEIVGAALPLLAIKPPYSKGPMKIVGVQAMLADIPMTISKILKLNIKFPGQSVFDIDPNKNRDRTYYHYKWRHEQWQADFFDRLAKYVIKGNMYDADSWHFNSIISPNKNLFATARLKFGTDDSAKFLLAGWSGNESSIEEKYTFNWAVGDSASVLLRLPRDHAVVLTANIKPYLFAKQQTISIKVDNKLIGSWKPHNIWEWQKCRIVIPPDKTRPDVSVVEFFFSQHLTPKKGGKDVRPLAVLFESITLSDLKKDN